MTPAFPGEGWVQLPPGSTSPLISRGGCGGLDVLAPDFEPFLFCSPLLYVPPRGHRGGVSVPLRLAITGCGRPPVMAPLGGYGGYYILLLYLFQEKRCIRYENEYTFFLLGLISLALLCDVVSDASLYALHRILRKISERHTCVQIVRVCQP